MRNRTLLVLVANKPPENTDRDFTCSINFLNRVDVAFPFLQVVRCHYGNSNGVLISLVPPDYYCCNYDNDSTFYHPSIAERGGKFRALNYIGTDGYKAVQETRMEGFANYGPFGDWFDRVL